ncbi:pilus assembly PilX N-terminal domain-containing protein [Eubacterium barkeri]|uniref:Uncharacterized protein n=1 Tax=Eubacterium barkeri TaxID=1528 RepID=A0A1H3AXB1_EUBBA|nr:pilus assembly PilX N-terminal domain-containing protein [Eubacterium barkeri]SDX34058.1 hypothetical protein SAMN04488579_101206 [Eubacterium barkeri]
MKQKLNSTAGSALIWVLVLCIIFAILGTAIAWVALSMNKRSVTNYVLRQDYFTSRSALDTCMNELNGLAEDQSYNNSFNAYLNANLVNGNKKIVITDFFGTAGATKPQIKNMGKCTVDGNYSKGIITLNAVTGTASEGKVSLTAYRKVDDKNLYWPNARWAVELPVSNDKFTVGGDDPNFKDEDNVVKDVAIYKVTTNQTGTLEITKDVKTEKKAIFIYVQPGVTLTINNITVSNPVGVASKSYNSVEAWFDGGDTSDWNTYYGPDIFIFLQGTETQNATLAFSKNLSTTGKDIPYPLYVSGSGATTAGVTGPEGSSKTLVYGIHNAGSNTVDFNKEKDQVPARLPISGYAYAGVLATGNETGLKASQWTVQSYTNGSDTP